MVLKSVYKNVSMNEFVEYFIRNKIVSAYFFPIPRLNKEVSNLEMKL